MSSNPAQNATVNAGSPTSPPGGRYLPIGEAANLLGVSIGILRKFEETGKIIPLKTLSGVRRYSFSDLQKIKDDPLLKTIPTNGNNGNGGSAGRVAEGVARPEGVPSSDRILSTVEGEDVGRDEGATGPQEPPQTLTSVLEELEVEAPSPPMPGPKPKKARLDSARQASPIRDYVAEGINPYQATGLLSVEQVAGKMGVSSRTIRRLIAKGKLRPATTGKYGSILIPTTQVDSLVNGFQKPSDLPIALPALSPSTQGAQGSARKLFFLNAAFVLIWLTVIGGGIFLSYVLAPEGVKEGVKGRIAAVFFGEDGGLTSPTPTIIEQTKQALITDYLRAENGNTVNYEVFFLERASFGSDGNTTIDSTGAITTSEPLTINDTSTSSLEIGGGMIAGTGNVYIIDRSGRIPALTSTYIADLDATSLTGKIDNADHLDNIDSSSFLRSNESDTAEGVINFTASPGSVNVNGGSVYINPAASTVNYTLFGVAVNGSSRFRVDAEGDTTIAGTLGAEGATTLSSTLAVTGNTTLSGTLGVTGNTTLTGDLAINGGDLTTSATTFNLLNSTATTLNIGGAATTLSIGAATGTTTVNNNLTVTGTATFSSNTAVLSSGQLTLTRNPTLAHTGTWAIGSSTWNASDATIYANPASPTADSNIFALSKNSSVQFAVDAEGDIYGNNLILAGSTSTGSTTIAGTLIVEGDTTLGDTTTDAWTANPATFTWNGGVSASNTLRTIDITGGGLRTLTLLNSTASQVTDLNLSDGDLQLGSTVRISNAGAGTLITLDTGQGAYELYAMDQNVLIASTPTFAQLTIDNTVFNADALTVTGTLLFDASVQTTVDTASTIASSAGAILDAFQVQGDTVTISGVTNITTATGFNLVDIKAPTYSNASIAVSSAATLYVAGAPSATGGMTITSPYALWIDAGISRLDGDVTLGGAISGGTTFSGSGNINTTGGALQTNSITRIDNDGAGTLASLTLTTDLAVADGGTGASTFTDAGVLLGNTTGAIQVTSAGTSGQVLTSNGAGVDPTFQAAAGGLSVPTAFTAALSNGF
ncbi:MAG: helix-turn-helix domain-containing protein [bacterium]|nr:helix-turn-helix domain-containing protein [bacterium]